MGTFTLSERDPLKSNIFWLFLNDVPPVFLMNMFLFLLYSLLNSPGVDCFLISVYFLRYGLFKIHTLRERNMLSVEVEQLQKILLSQVFDSRVAVNYYYLISSVIINLYLQFAILLFNKK